MSWSSRWSGNQGIGTPCRPMSSRSRYLSRAASAAATELPARPSERAISAATTTVSSSTPSTPSTGYRAAKARAWSAAVAGCEKSSVSRASGRDASNVLGSSEATVRSTPRWRAASTNAVVRYVAVGSSRRRRGRLLLGGGEVRVVSGGVVRDVHDPFHFRNVLGEHSLDSLTQRHARHAASLTTAAHPQQHDRVLDVDQLDAPPVAGDHRVDLLLEQVVHPLVQLVVGEAGGAGRRRLVGYRRRVPGEHVPDRRAHRLPYHLPGVGRVLHDRDEVGSDDDLADP